MHAATDNPLEGSLQNIFQAAVRDRGVLCWLKSIRYNSSRCKRIKPAVDHVHLSRQSLSAWRCSDPQTMLQLSGRLLSEATQSTLRDPMPQLPNGRRATSGNQSWTGSGRDLMLMQMIACLPPFCCSFSRSQSFSVLVCRIPNEPSRRQNQKNLVDSLGSRYELQCGRALPLI